MNHNPSLNLFKLLWVAAIFGMCTWSASPLTAQAQGESPSKNPCVENVDKWLVKPVKTGGVGDGAGSKGKSSIVTRKVSELGGEGTAPTTTQIFTSFDSTNRVTLREISKNGTTVKRVECEYAPNTDNQILVAAVTEDFATKTRESQVVVVDERTRAVSADGNSDEALNRLAYDAEPTDALSPALLEEAIYQWAITRYTQPLSGAERDGKRRFDFKSEADLASGKNGRPFFQTIYYRRDVKTKQSSVRKVEMCFAESWSRCVSSSTKPPVKRVITFKPMITRKPNYHSILVLTEEIGTNSPRRSEELELQNVDFKLIEN